MKRLLSFLVFLCLVWNSPAGALTTVRPETSPPAALPTTITAPGVTASEVVTSFPTVSIQLSGTWTGTIQFEGSNDNNNFVTVNCFPSNSVTAVVNTTSNGIWNCAVGMNYFRLNATAWTSGTATVTVNKLAAKVGGWAGGGGGGGSGTVNSGTINQLAYYPAGGTAVSGETLLQAANMPALTGVVTNTPGTVATTSASKFLVQGTADSNLTAAQFLGSLSSGCLSVTTTTGVVASSGSPCGTSGGVATTGSPVSGQVSFFTGGATISGDNNLTWDNTAKTLSFGTGNAVTITTAALTGNRTFTLPDANSNPVIPDAGASNNFLTAISSAGVISKAQPAFSNLSGTATVSQGGTGQTTLTNHGLLVGASTSAITQLTAALAGTVLTGQGASSDPLFSATPVLGASGTTGTLGFAGTTSGVVTIQPQSAAGTYNFNLPTTAGTAGQVLTSQGGGSSAMTWTTGGSTLSSITAATGANTIASGNNTGQVWNWANTTNTTVAFTIGETTAATNGTSTSGVPNQVLHKISTLAASTQSPLSVYSRGAHVFSVAPTTAQILATNGTVSAPAYGFASNQDTGMYWDGSLLVLTRVGSAIFFGTANSIYVTPGTSTAPGLIDITTQKSGLSWNLSANSLSVLNNLLETVRWDSTGRQYFKRQTAVPTMGACGTSPSVTVGTDNAMLVTVGTGGTATSCAVNFGAAYLTNAPICTALNDTDRVSYNISTSTTVVTITATAAFTASSKFHVHCLGAL